MYANSKDSTQHKKALDLYIGSLIYLATGCGSPDSPFVAIGNDAGVDAATTTDARANDATTNTDAQATGPYTFRRLVDGQFGEFRAAWGPTSSDIHFIAYSGYTSQFLHYDGNELSSLASVRSELTDLWGVASNDVWAVGPDGTYAVYRGAWRSPSASEAPTNGDMYATWGSARGRWAVGYNFGSNGIASTFGESGRDSWTTSGDVGNVPRSNGRLEDWRAVGGFGMHIFVSGRNSTYHWDGTSWTSFGDIGAIDMYSGYGFVAYTNTLRVGLIVPNPSPGGFNTSPFSAVEFDLPNGVPNYSIRRVWASRDEYWFGGTNGLCYRRTDAGWERVELGTTDDVTMLWHSGTAIWVGTTRGLYYGMQ